MKVVCQDARIFRPEDHGDVESGAGDVDFALPPSYFTSSRVSVMGADLITLSYSLSVIVSLSICLTNPANWYSPTSTLSPTP